MSWVLNVVGVSSCLDGQGDVEQTHCTEMRRIEGERNTSNTESALSCGPSLLAREGLYAPPNFCNQQGASPACIFSSLGQSLSVLLLLSLGGADKASESG